MRKKTEKGEEGYSKEFHVSANPGCVRFILFFFSFFTFFVKQDPKCDTNVPFFSFFFFFDNFTCFPFPFFPFILNFKIKCHPPQECIKSIYKGEKEIRCVNITSLQILCAYQHLFFYSLRVNGSSFGESFNVSFIYLPHDSLEIKGYHMK